MEYFLFYNLDGAVFWERFRNNTIVFAGKKNHNNKSELYPRPQLPLDVESWTNLASSLCKIYLQAKAKNLLKLNFIFPI